MTNSFLQQLQKATEPFNAVMQANTKAMREFSDHQTQLFTGWLDDSKRFVKTVSKEPNPKAVMAAGSAFSQSMRDRVTHSSKENVASLSSLRDEVTGVLSRTMNRQVPQAPNQVAKATEEVATKAATNLSKATEQAQNVVAKAQKVTESASTIAKGEAEVKPAATKTTATRKPATRSKRSTTAKPSTKSST